MKLIPESLMPELPPKTVLCGTKIFYAIMMELGCLQLTDPSSEKTVFLYMEFTFFLHPWLPENALVTTDPELVKVLEEMSPREQRVH